MAEANRRKLLKSMTASAGAVAVGKALPESWSKPVIESVMLPAHAKATDDSGSLPPDTTMAPCVIEGDYCWIEGSNAHTVITVTSDGGITINRTFIKPAMSWTGTGTTSNGPMGGTFSIQAPGNNGENRRDYTGTIVCNSTGIEATVINPRSGTTADFEATQAACSKLPS